MNEPLGGTWEVRRPRHGVSRREARDNVARLRGRIFKAEQAGDRRKVRNLQKLMLRSHSNTLVSVERVTEVNAGRMTAGIDGQLALTDQARTDLIHQVDQVKSWQARPARRVYIPKAGNRKKLRPLSIPVIFDRVLQARVKNALEPQWEARFGAHSYGFRPGRSCQDAIELIFNTGRGAIARRVWWLDADLAAAFDRVDHDRIMSMLGSFPGNGLIRQWLKAGVIDKGSFSATVEGTPQGGVISPLIFNVALHGLEEAAGVRYVTSGAHAGRVTAASPMVVIYADDLVVGCHSLQQAHQVKQRLAEWLAPRGLGFNEAKTQIVHLEQGFDFVGFNVRRYDNKLLIKPSKAAIKRIRERLRREFRALRGAPVLALIRRINQIVRGWAAYYRGGVSSKVFTSLDDHLWKLSYKWAKHRHPTKPKKWVAARYFGRFHPTRNDRWVFGDRDSGAYMHRFSWTKIVRHTLVKGRASPDDPALAGYWAARRRRNTPPLDDGTLVLLHMQQGCCPLCGDHLLHADRPPGSPQEWEQWFRATSKAIGKHQIVETGEHGRPDEKRRRLVHAHCHRRIATDGDMSPAFLPARQP